MVMQFACATVMLYEIMKLFAMCHVSQYTFEDIGRPSEIVCEILIQILLE